MDFVKSYWWVFAGLLVVLLIFGRSKQPGGGVTVTQIGNDGTGLAQINAEAQAADQANRFGLISSLLQYDLSNRELASNERLSFEGLHSNERVARIQADAQAEQLRQQSLLDQYGYNTQAELARLQLQAQQAALRSNNQGQWLGLLNTGLQNLLPLFLGRNNNGGSGGFGTPSIFGSNSGTWRDWSFGFRW